MILPSLPAGPCSIKVTHSLEESQAFLLNCGVVASERVLGSLSGLIVTECQSERGASHNVLVLWTTA